jgi:subtilisin family serine protease
VDTDWNGHGTRIGGNIAARDGKRVNGIAPGVKLVSLKIAEWCGFAFDSSTLEAYQHATDNDIDVVSISFGGYLDRSDPEQEPIYQLYVDSVRYGMKKGTTYVAAAGNEHVRIGAGGRVISHGPLTAPGQPFDDLFGLYELPGGIPGVVNVSATGNVVKGASLLCTPASSNSNNATCKPSSDAHQPAGVGRRNQLTYYSNYGPRIDTAAPGGARKFNRPAPDRGGTPGYPATTDEGTKAYQTFSITSNWATGIPCYIFTDPDFYQGECYTTIQGTSMAAPHVSAVVAPIASEHHSMRDRPLLLIFNLKRTAWDIRGNKTQALSATDTSPATSPVSHAPPGIAISAGRPSAIATPTGPATWTRRLPCGNTRHLARSLEPAREGRLLPAVLIRWSGDGSD